MPTKKKAAVAAPEHNVEMPHGGIYRQVHPGGWIGVDLDGTLAKYKGWVSHKHIGEPILPMVIRIKRWLAQGITVKIFTARVAPHPARTSHELNETVEAIEAWCQKVFGRELPITAMKDHGMIQLWDDRAVTVEPNTGRRMDGVYDPI